MISVRIIETVKTWTLSKDDCGYESPLSRQIQRMPEMKGRYWSIKFKWGFE